MPSSARPSAVTERPPAVRYPCGRCGLSYIAHHAMEEELGHRYQAQEDIPGLDDAKVTLR
jgi:predicted RNA-binding Zn-ribbon protein involved in translation (DUF1610 family)